MIIVALPTTHWERYPTLSQLEVDLIEEIEYNIGNKSLKIQ